MPFRRLAGLSRQISQELGSHLARIPSQCAVCQTWPAQRVCTACVVRFAPPRQRCSGCALAVPPGVDRCGTCIRESSPLQACLAAVDYGYPWARIVASFKFQGDPAWAAALAAWMASVPGAGKALAQADAVLPVPLSNARIRERGFNQAALLARHLAPAKTDEHSLLRWHSTPAQSGLQRAERLRNLQGALALDPLRQPAFRGLRVVLVDDVMTTGATLEAASQVLRQAGVAHITGLVFARTPRR